MAGAAPKKVEMRSCLWFDTVVTKLDVLEFASVFILCFKEVANTSVAFFILQDFVADIFICKGFLFTVLCKGDGVFATINADIGNICLVTCCVVGFVLFGSFIFIEFCLVVPDLIKCAVLKIRINRLPITTPVRQGAVFNSTCLKVAIFNCFFACVRLCLNLFTLDRCCLLKGFEV